MSDKSGSTASGVVEFVPEQQSFMVTPVDLKSLLRRIDRQSRHAVEALVKLLDSKDEKIRLTAATKLLEFQVSIAKEINTDQLQRMIAEIRNNPGASNKLVPNDQKNRPLVDFTTIREVD